MVAQYYHHLGLFLIGHPKWCRDELIRNCAGSTLVNNVNPAENIRMN